MEGDSPLGGAGQQGQAAEGVGQIQAAQLPGVMRAGWGGVGGGGGKDLLLQSGGSSRVCKLLQMLVCGGVRNL